MQSSPSGLDPLDPGPIGFAHRGLHDGSGSPENSLTAFAAALEMGAGIECDLRLTADNQIVVFHDADGRRQCASPMRIGQSTLNQLSRLRVGDQPIPTLHNLLNLIRGRSPLLLEIKVDRDIRRWMSALGEALRGYEGRFGVMSFDPRVARLLKTNLPAVRRGLVLRGDLLAWRRGLALRVADPHFIAVEHTALERPWIVRARERWPIYSWTIRSPAERAQAKVHADVLIWENDGRPGI
jgi:glycerophosphoryl diester phosphodiesterase